MAKDGGRRNRMLAANVTYSGSPERTYIILLRHIMMFFGRHESGNSEKEIKRSFLDSAVVFY